MIAIEIPKVKYLTVSASRYLTLDEPCRYVNPNRTKYVHQCNGPIAAIAAGASALSAGFATAGFMGGLMMIGGVAGIVGGLTGNKTLMALGSIAGMAGGFVTPEGAFNNPFTSLGESSAAKGFSSVFDGIKETLGFGEGYVMPPSVDGYLETGEEILSAAGGNDAIATAASNVAKTGGGFLQRLGDTKGILSLAGGAAEAYQNQPLIDSKIENLDANTSATQTQEGILKQRQENMQFQNTGNMPTVNPNANPFQSAPGSATGRYAVVIDGQIKYITPAEYAQLQSAKSASGGLINQGVPSNG